MIISCPSCGASFNVKPEALGPTGRSVKCSKCAHRWHATPEGFPSFEMPAAPDAGADEPAAAPADAENQIEETEATPEPDAAAEAEVPADAVAGTDDADGPADADAADGDEEIQAADDQEPSAEPDVPQGLEAALGLSIPDSLDDDAEEPSRAARRHKETPAPRKRRRSIAKVLSFFVLLLLVAGVGGAAFFLNQEIMMWMPATQRLYAMVGIKPQVLGQGLQIVEPTPKKEIDGNDEILVVEGEIRNTTAKPIDIPLMRGALLDKQGKELHIWTFTAAKSSIEPGENAPYRTEFRNPPSDAESLDITFTRSKEVMGTATQDAKMTESPGDGAMNEGKPKDGEKDGTEKGH